jgi:hypothetical protein
MTDLAQQLQAVEKEKQRAEAALQQRLDATQFEAARDHDALTQQTATLNARAADLQSQLEAVRQQDSLPDADLKSARQEILNMQRGWSCCKRSCTIQEATPQPDPSEVGSLVAARNLHIIDVYDSNPNGKRPRLRASVL